MPTQALAKERVTGNGASFIIESHRHMGMRLRTRDGPKVCSSKYTLRFQKTQVRVCGGASSQRIKLSRTSLYLFLKHDATPSLVIMHIRIIPTPSARIAFLPNIIPHKLFVILPAFKTTQSSFFISTLVSFWAFSIKLLATAAVSLHPRCLPQNLDSGVVVRKLDSLASSSRLLRVISAPACFIVGSCLSWLRFSSRYCLRTKKRSRRSFSRPGESILDTT
jgi:hypothetical protein